MTTPLKTGEFAGFIRSRGFAATATIADTSMRPRCRAHPWMGLLYVDAPVRATAVCEQTAWNVPLNLFKLLKERLRSSKDAPHFEQEMGCCLWNAATSWRTEMTSSPSYHHW